MANIPTQEEVLAATRKSQEAMIATLRAWLETVRAATPRLTSVYAPLTERLPKLPPVTLPFAGKLPTPEEAVGSAYHMAEQLLANQRKFTEDLVKAVTPLMPGHSQGSPEVPSRSAWRDAVAVSKPEPVAVSKPEPVVGATSAAPEAAPTRPAAKSTPVRPAAGTTAAKTTRAKSAEAKSAAAKSGAAKSAPKRTTANRAPKGTDAS
jgi:ribonuclease E